jgi:hypothetical protein
LPTAAGVAAVKRFEQAVVGVAGWLFGELQAAELGALHDQLKALKRRLEAKLPPGEAD